MASLKFSEFSHSNVWILAKYSKHVHEKNAEPYWKVIHRIISN